LLERVLTVLTMETKRSVDSVSKWCDAAGLTCAITATRALPPMQSLSSHVSLLER